jgi:hypothetical protein
MTRKTSKSVVPAATAALAWTSLGFRWMEMMAASSQVIARRTRRNPTPAQWVHMGSEKAQAALRSGNAMARSMTSLPLGDPMAMWGAWARVLSAGMTPYRAKAVSNSRSRRRR